MIDFILFSFVAGVFYGGFWSGSKWGTLKAMASACKATVNEWMK
jgi:hypothetical protein